MNVVRAPIAGSKSPGKRKHAIGTWKINLIIIRVAGNRSSIRCVGIRGTGTGKHAWVGQARHRGRSGAEVQRVHFITAVIRSSATPHEQAITPRVRGASTPGIYYVPAVSRKVVHHAAKIVRRSEEHTSELQSPMY